MARSSTKSTVFYVVTTHPGRAQSWARARGLNADQWIYVEQPSRLDKLPAQHDFKLLGEVQKRPDWAELHAKLAADKVGQQRLEDNGLN